MIGLCTAVIGDVAGHLGCFIFLKDSVNAIAFVALGTSVPGTDIALGVVHKLRLQEEGGRWSKKLTFCKLLYHRKCKRRGVGGQKKPNFVNVVKQI